MISDSGLRYAAPRPDLWGLDRFRPHPPPKTLLTCKAAVPAASPTHTYVLTLRIMVMYRALARSLARSEVGITRTRPPQFGDLAMAARGPIDVHGFLAPVASVGYRRARINKIESPATTNSLTRAGSETLTLQQLYARTNEAGRRIASMRAARITLVDKANKYDELCSCQTNGGWCRWTS